MKPATKPPLGLRPRTVHDAHRIYEIHQAIKRYTDAYYAIPIEWITEYNELIARLPEE